jgi:hypothetical protein
LCGATKFLRTLLLPLALACFLERILEQRELQGRRRAALREGGANTDAFRALLRFIYTDALPPQLEKMGRWPETRKDDQEVVSMARRLLEAADRYGVERLKVICEEKVCASVGVGTVATDLVLAERRGYKKLKDRCMEFLVASQADMLAVAAAGGCKLLEATCPSVLTEMLMAVADRSCQLGLGGGTRS